MEEKENISFEEAMNNLEKLVDLLESGKVKLDEAFNTFEEGIKYAKICEDKLLNIEQKVAKILNENNKEDNLDIEQ